MFITPPGSVSEKGQIIAAILFGLSFAMIIAVILLRKT